MLAEDPERKLFGADNSQDMIDSAKRFQDKETSDRFKCFQTSAFSIDMPDSSVDNIFCMRLLHHIAAEADRLTILKEFYRVTKDTVCLSMWADGNLQYRKRKRNEAKRSASRLEGSRVAITAQQAESEYREAGFRVLGHLDLLPGLSMWRFYILKKEN
jgi:ubiquinone/menaquinone biosynthesis C-methylase UbiE